MPSISTHYHITETMEVLLKDYSTKYGLFYEEGFQKKHAVLSRTSAGI